MSQRQVVILAAGKGTRLGRELPKPLTLLDDGRSILRQQVDNIRACWPPDTAITAVVGFRAQPWDCAAGLLLVSEAGGIVGDLKGPTLESVPSSGDVLAAPAQLWEELRQILTPVYEDLRAVALTPKVESRA